MRLNNMLPPVPLHFSDLRKGPFSATALYVLLRQNHRLSLDTLTDFQVMQQRFSAISAFEALC